MEAAARALCLSAGETLCFLSHDEGSAGAEALLLRDKLCASLGLRADQVFLGGEGDAGRDRVASARVLVLLLTREALTRPSVLAEVSCSRAPLPLQF
jgi:hypothetical protein